MLIQDKNIISNENELVKVFNKHYRNIIEKSGGQKPTNIAKRNSIDNDRQAFELICNSYRNHPSILKIKVILQLRETLIITPYFHLSIVMKFENCSSN